MHSTHLVHVTVILLATFMVKVSHCNEGFIVRHYSGLCLALENGTKALYLSQSCDERFSWTRYNTIMHVKTSMCLIPESVKDDAKIVARKECKNLNAAFMISANLSLQHIKSSKCLHPYWGCPVPSQGEDIVLHTACNEERLKFQFVKDNADCSPLYPYCRRKPSKIAQYMSVNKSVNVSQSQSVSLCPEVISGLDWHWVYIIVVTASALILGQFMFIICMYTRMTARPTKSKEDSLRFGRSTRKKQSLPCDDSDDVKMIKITSTDVDLEANEFSDGSSFADELESSPPQIVETLSAPKSEEKRPYINIDYNQNANSSRKSKKRKTTKERNSKRLSKLSVDMSKMRHLFKIRKSYTLNDLEMLKRISIERHQYAEPVSPFSSESGDTEKQLDEIKKEGSSGYVDPDAKPTRTRSASVPAKFTSQQQQQQPYLKPVISDRDRKKCCEGTYTSYMNVKPASPIRDDKNLYDMPEMALLEEDEDMPLQMEATYLEILED